MSPACFETSNIETLLCYGTCSVKIQDGSFSEYQAFPIDTKACHAVDVKRAVQLGTLTGALVSSS